MPILVFIALFLALTACGTESSAHREWSAPTPPIEIFLSESIAHHDKDLQAALTLWNRAAGVTLLNFGGIVPWEEASAAGPNGLSTVTELYKWTSELQATAPAGLEFSAVTILRDQDGTQERDIYLNFEAFDFDGAIETGKKSVDARRVLAHELGHVLGLDHTNKPADLMFYASNEAQTFLLTPGDLSALKKKLSLPQ